MCLKSGNNYRGYKINTYHKAQGKKSLCLFLFLFSLFPLPSSLGLWALVFDPASILQPPASILQLLSSGFYPPASTLQLLSSSFYPPASILQLLHSGFYPPASILQLLSSGFYPPASILQLLSSSFYPPASIL